MVPTDVLEDEHRLIERAIHVASITADSLNNNEPPPTGLLRGIVNFMQRYVVDYHQKREDLILFELLEQKGVSDKGCPLAPIRNDHQKIQARLAELSDAVAAYSSSNQGTERVVQSLITLTEIYPHHLWIENFLLFPMTNKLLREDEQALLSQRMSQADAAHPSTTHEEMTRVIEELELGASTLRQRSAAQVSTQELAGAQRIPEPVRGTVMGFNLAEEAARLRQERAWEHGRNAKTLVKFPDLRLVLTVIRAGQTLTEHRDAGRIYIQTLSGHLRVEALDKVFDLPAGQAVALDREVPHRVASVEDSTFITSVVWTQQHAAGQT
jgi:hemerythrin-like domain-containing protein/quercetin dioxygenase-like cupin family protein